MIPWIQVYSNLPTHKKTSKLAETLSLPSSSVGATVIASGLLVCLWSWAIQNAYDGDLSDCSAETIAEACRWKKSPQKLVEALKESGYLDNDMKLHDWEEYALLLIDAEDNRKEKVRARAKKYREKRKSSRDDNVTHRVTECDDNVTRHAPTIPYQTIPDHNVTKSNDSFSLGRKKDKKERNDELAEILRDAGIDPTPYT